MIVGSWVVLAASYEAKAHGIKTAMSGSRARRLCPGAIVVEPRFSAYTEASRAMYRVFDDTTPVVEGLSIDEAFLDVRGMERIAGTPAAIAARLRREVRERVGLPITVGVARTKFLAKVASGVAKPDGLLVVPPHGELAFLHPLPVERLWGVGDVTAAKLHARGITTVGEVALLGEEVLVAMLGRGSGRHLHALANNRDPRPVVIGRRRRSIGSQRALGRSPKSLEAIDASVVALVDRVTRRMRAARRVGRTVVLRMRFDDFSRATRSHTLARATAQTQPILATARGLLAASVPLIEQPGADARRASRSPTSTTSAPSSSRCRSTTTERGRSTSPWTACASASARARSRVGCCSGAIRASRCRCCPIEALGGGWHDPGVQTIEIDTPHGEARAHLRLPEAAPRAALILGHGAGGGVTAPDLVAAAGVALAHGVGVALVEQPYRVAGRRSPAPAAHLDAAWIAVCEALGANELQRLPLLAGGRSSGARVACRTAGATGAVGVLCLAFPLVPPRRTGPPAASRLPELDAVAVPVLIVQGASDPFGMPPAGALREIAVLQGDHSLRKDLRTLAAAVEAWLRVVVPG